MPTIRPINQIGMLPRLAPPLDPTDPDQHVGFSTRRGRFLTGAIRAFYGPVQRPDTGEEFNEPSEGLGHYDPPHDWPAAGMLLRPPQVVWLSAWMAYATFNLDAYLAGGYADVAHYWNNAIPFHQFHDGETTLDWSAAMAYTVSVGLAGTHYDVTAIGECFGPAGGWTLTYYQNPLDDPPGSGNLTVATGGGTYDPVTSYLWYDQQIVNPYQPEYDRLIAAFGVAKTRIEALRPNRTFIQVIEPLHATDAYGLATAQSYFTHHADNDYYWHMIAPRYKQEYLGTDFLHVFVGHPTGTYGSIGVPSNLGIDPILDVLRDDDKFRDGLRNVWYAQTSDNTDQLNIGAVEPAVRRERFTRFTVRVYGVDVAVGTLPAAGRLAYVRAPEPPQQVITTTSHGDFFHPLPDTFDTIDPWEQYTAEVGGFGGHTDAEYTAILAGQYDTLDAAITAKNADNAARDPTANAGLRAHCNWLHDVKGLDFAYLGESSAVTATALVNLIASHFGFSPTTGLDLPL